MRRDCLLLSNRKKNRLGLIIVAILFVMASWRLEAGYANATRLTLIPTEDDIKVDDISDGGMQLSDKNLAKETANQGKLEKLMRAEESKSRDL